MTQLNKNYWESRYETQNTGWDIGHISPPIKSYIDQLNDKTIKILIPGAGNAYEFEYLLQQGFQNSKVIDIAKQPLENLKARLPNLVSDHYLLGDFFDHNGTYDLIIEQTFFCALDPSLRQSYAAKMHQLLNIGGKLVGLLFDFPLNQVEPPFGGSLEEYLECFEPLFKIKTLTRAFNSIKPRANKELFFIFEKK
jgi:methyl halide transferase